MNRSIFYLLLALAIMTSSVSLFAHPSKLSCYRDVGSRLENILGCVGRIGLIRIRKSSENPTPVNIENASQVLFGSPELPQPGSEVAIRRSAHMREWYDKKRDDQFIAQAQKICVGFWCKHLPVKPCRVLPDQTVQFPDCPHPTHATQYFPAGTVVKVLGYQQMGHLFALVQIVKIEGRDPEEDEKKYECDRDEVI